MSLPYHWLGINADYDPEVLMSYEIARLYAADIAGILPSFECIQDDE